MRELSLSDTIYVLENCTKRNSSKCNYCILNEEYGDACIEIKDHNALKHLKNYEREGGESEKLKKIEKYEKNRRNK